MGKVILTWRWLVLALAMLALAPAWVAASHGPGPQARAEAAAAVEDARLPSHGHSHAEDASALRHDATDHEHQVQGLVPMPAAMIRPASGEARPLALVALEGRVPKDPDRPPRPA